MLHAALSRIRQPPLGFSTFGALLTAPKVLGDDLPLAATRVALHQHALLTI
jgi:hypothetical protein